jgi:predicted component of type VI protein secretion system
MSTPPLRPRAVEGGWVLAGSDADGRIVRLVFGETELTRAYLGLAIGRHPELNDRVLADAAISRRHCRVGMAESALFVEDLNSLNGTFVDGVALFPFVPQTLAPGQQLSIGRVTLSVARLEA